MKIRHILLALGALLAIAFMQPLVTFLGGLTLLLGAGALIVRDLSPSGQEALERRVLGWLRRARGGPPNIGTAVEPGAQPSLPDVTGQLPPVRVRRVRQTAPLSRVASEEEPAGD